MKIFNRLAIVIVLLGFAALLIGPQLASYPEMNQRHVERAHEYDLLGNGRQRIEPLPLSVSLNGPKVALGRRLFEDPRLGGGQRACSHCHDLANGGVDGRPRAAGEGPAGLRNTPTVFNAALNGYRGWQGEAVELTDYLRAKFDDPRQMTGGIDAALKALSADSAYRNSFDDIYPDGISADNLLDALAEYLRSLITPNANFDRYLRGDVAALTPAQLRGFHLFRDYGCDGCHQGVNVGGNMLSFNGLFVGQAEQDDHSDAVLRVPSLRNVAQTAPYFHDGSAPDLADAIRRMGQFQLGRPMAKEHVMLIEGFLRTLTGEYQGRNL